MINPYQIKAKEQPDKAELDSQMISKTGTDLLKNLPEEKRIEIFKAMLEEKKSTSPKNLLSDL